MFDIMFTFVFIMSFIVFFTIFFVVIRQIMVNFKKSKSAIQSIYDKNLQNFLNAKDDGVCEYCGCKINPSSNKCPSCGAKIKSKKQ